MHSKRNRDEFTHWFTVHMPTAAGPLCSQELGMPPKPPMWVQGA